MVSKRIFSRLTFCAGVSAEGGSLDPEQLETARNIIAKPGCVHSLWSAAGAGKSYVLAVLLADWAKKAAATSLAFFVTGRRRHRDPILALLRQLLPPQAIWVLAGDSETPDPSTQLQAGAEGHARDRLASILDRLEDLDEKIDAVGPAEVSALALHAERVMVLFCHYLCGNNAAFRSKQSMQPGLWSQPRTWPETNCTVSPGGHKVGPWTCCCTMRWRIRPLQS